MTNKTEFLHILSYNQKNYNYKESIATLKRVLIEVSFKSFKRLKLNGIGYKFIIISKLNTIIHLKLGYSHSIYFKLPESVTAKLTKNNVLFLLSNSNEKLLTVSEAIRSCKIPDPYKGKGIMYANEKINLKLGKKL
jgi:large subunit ribosomal protein L6